MHRAMNRHKKQQQLLVVTSGRGGGGGGGGGVGGGHLFTLSEVSSSHNCIDSVIVFRPVGKIVGVGNMEHHLHYLEQRSYW